MKVLNDIIIHVVERAFDTIEECKLDEKEMTGRGYVVDSEHHDIYLFYRKYRKKM